MSTPPTKIVIVFNSLDVGGIETKIVDLCHYFSHRSQYQLILLLKHYRGLFLPLIPGNTPILTPSLTDFLKLRTLFFPLWLARQFSRHKPTIILSFGNYSSICSVLGKIISRVNSPLIISEDSSITTQLEKESFSWIRKMLLRITYPLATRIIVLSQAGSQKLRKYISTHKNITIIPNWVSPRFTDMLSGNAPPKDIDILFLGRFEDQKNPLRFVRIVKLISSKKPNLSCLMVGDGSLKPQTQKFINKLKLDKIIKILPATTYPALYLLRSKVLLLTSNHEGFPLTLLEAGVSHCLPVIATLQETDDYFSQHRKYLIYKNDKEASEKTEFLIRHDQIRQGISNHYAMLAHKNQHTNLQMLQELLSVS